MRQLLALDFPRRRMYVLGTHWHHGATGALLLLASQRLRGNYRRAGAVIGASLMLHDKTDWPWFGVK